MADNQEIAGLFTKAFYLLTGRFEIKILISVHTR
jgi:hypothetical protein